MSASHLVVHVSNAIKLLNKLYQCTSIYHALYVYEGHEMSTFDKAFIISMLENNYPLCFFDKDNDFLTRARIIFISYDDLIHVHERLYLFTIALTSSCTVFQKMLENPLYESLTISNFSCANN